MFTGPLVSHAIGFSFSNFLASLMCITQEEKVGESVTVKSYRNE